MTIKTHGRMMTNDTIGISQLDLQDGTANQAIVTDGQGVLRFATVGAGGSVGSSVYIEDIRTGDGSTVTFTLSAAAPYEESILVFIDGVAQPTASFTLPSTTSITFTPAPGNGAAIRICHLGIASSIADNSITGAKIAMGGDTVGDILYFNGTDYQRLTIGTAGQHLATNSATTAPEWVTDSTASGSIVQSKSVIYTTQSTFTSSYGSLGIRRTTAFLISEGTELQTLTITPTSTNNYLRIFASVLLDVSADGVCPMLVLHRDAITNGLQMSSGKNHTAGWHAGDPGHLTLNHIMQVPSTSAQTYRIRAGTSAHFTAGALYINRGNQLTGATIWGGVGQSVMTIVEYVP